MPSMSTTNGARMIPARGNAENNNWKTLVLPLDPTGRAMAVKL